VASYSARQYDVKQGVGIDGEETNRFRGQHRPNATAFVRIGNEGIEPIVHQVARQRRFQSTWQGLDVLDLGGDHLCGEALHRPLGLLHGQLAGFDLEHVIRGLTSRPQAFTNSRAEPLQIGVAAGALIFGRGIDLGPFHRMRVVPDQEFKDPAFRLGQAAQARVRATLIRMATALTPSELGAAAAYFAKKTGRRGPPAPPPRHRRP
jgi:hypothetical protein